MSNANSLESAESYLGISREAIEKADLSTLLVSMLARIRQLEVDVEVLRKLVIPVEASDAKG